MLRIAAGVLLVASSVGSGAASAPGFAGRWDVWYTLGGASRTLRLEAAAGGRATLTLRDPRSNMVAPAAPTPARWKEAGTGRVTFSGSVEFPIGNVGREPGTLVFSGVMKGDRAIAGEVSFYPPDQDPASADSKPSRTGTFTAARIP